MTTDNTFADQARVLFIIPPYVPSYFNAGHHLPVFQVAAYIRRRFPNCHVTAVDAAALNVHWRDICDLLVGGFDVIGMLNDYDGIDGFDRFLLYARELTPKAKTFTFGRLSNQAAGLFRRHGIDGIVESGDYECGAERFVRWALGGTREGEGLSYREESGYTTALPGERIEPEQWVFPEIGEIPYSAYESMYKRDQAKFCGIPERRELVVPMARGCPVGCTYCDVPIMQGRKERRTTVEATLDYIARSFRSGSFEYVSFYAPTFTLQRRWVVELCEAITQRAMKFSWKCVTTSRHLDAELLSLMKAAGCVRVSLGVETFERAAALTLPRLKHDGRNEFRRLAKHAGAIGLELNCFVIAGLPGDTVEGLRRTIHEVLDNGARVRPTVYTPYNQLRDDASAVEVASYNRQTFVGDSLSLHERAQLYDLLYANAADMPTQVMKHIEVNAALREQRHQ